MRYVLLSGVVLCLCVFVACGDGTDLRPAEPLPTTQNKPIPQASPVLPQPEPTSSTPNPPVYGTNQYPLRLPCKSASDCPSALPTCQGYCIKECHPLQDNCLAPTRCFRIGDVHEGMCDFRPEEPSGEPRKPVRKIGESCWLYFGWCAAGGVCVDLTSEGIQGSCEQTCNTQSDCRTGTTCTELQSGFKVCVRP